MSETLPELSETASIHPYAVATTEEQAIDARQRGEFERAAQLFAQAAEEADELQARLNLQIRQACCMLATDHYEAAAELATGVAHHARAGGHLPELVDALGVIVDHHSRENRLAEAAELLAEAVYTLELLPHEPANYQVVHNMAVTYVNCGFVEAALELYDRALRLATNDDDRQFVYSSMSAAYHLASLREPTAEARDRLLHDGLYAATAALDPEGGNEVLVRGGALAHRSMMLAEIGHFHAALDDARTARVICGEHGMREEQVVAMAGEAMARWGLSHDSDVLELIGDTIALASEISFSDYLEPLRRVEVSVLWNQERYDDARIAMERNQRHAARRMYDERAARWEHVRLGVAHRRHDAASERDTLTGLPNRNALTHLLPEVLDDHAPVCVGVVDLDLFDRINSQYGYELGDSVLQEVARVLERVCRRGDSVVRLGADEFAMVLRETSPGDARVVFERVRQLISARKWHGIPSEVKVSASIGVAVGSGAGDAERMLHDAAAAVTNAKKSGRDRIAFR